MPPCGSSMAPSPWGSAPNCCDRAADDSERADPEQQVSPIPTPHAGTPRDTSLDGPSGSTHNHTDDRPVFRPLALAPKEANGGDASGCRESDGRDRQEEGSHE